MLAVCDFCVTGKCISVNNIITIMCLNCLDNSKILGCFSYKTNSAFRFNTDYSPETAITLARLILFVYFQIGTKLNCEFA